MLGMHGVKLVKWASLASVLVVEIECLDTGEVLA